MARPPRAVAPSFIDGREQVAQRLQLGNWFQRLLAAPGDGRETLAQRLRVGHRERESMMLQLAGSQFGAVAFWQLFALGFSQQEIARRVQAGRLHRLYRGVYAVGRSDLPPDGHRMAAVLACGDMAMLSHISCAAHRGLRLTASSYAHVTIPRRSGLCHPGIKLHRVPTLTAEDMDVVDGIPCTSVGRTLLDLASMKSISDRGVESAVEQAEINGRYDQRAIERLLARVAGQPGSTRLARACGIARPGETVTASDLEEQMLTLCRSWGLPEPEVNVWIQLCGEPAKVDFLWREHKVVVETDAFAYHKTRAAFRRDRRRDRLLELEGFGHARFADEDFDDDLDGIERTLRALLGR